MLNVFYKIVAIIESRSNKRCAGAFSDTVLSGVNTGDLLFIPMDSRLPRLLVAKSSLAEDMLKNIKDIISRKIVYEARITEWEEGAQNARAVLSNEIGDPNDLQVQMDAILVDKNIDTRDWETFEVDDELPGSDWKITDDQVAKRRDFRRECVFTIDPQTARDLDDALHIKKLDDDVYEVGVHIADVAFFVPPGGKIDKVDVFLTMSFETLFIDSITAMYLSLHARSGSTYASTTTMRRTLLAQSSCRTIQFFSCFQT